MNSTCNKINVTSLKTSMPDYRIVWRSTDKVTEYLEMVRRRAVTIKESKDTDICKGISKEAYYSTLIDVSSVNVQDVIDDKNTLQTRVVKDCQRALEVIYMYKFDESSLHTAWRYMTKHLIHQLEDQVIRYEVIPDWSRSGVRLVIPSTFNNYRCSSLATGNLYDSKKVMSAVEARDIPVMMNKLYSFYGNKEVDNSILQSIIMHFYIGHVAPMCDANGRVARLTGLWGLDAGQFHMLRQATVSKQLWERKQEYLETFNRSQYNTIVHNKEFCTDITEFIEFMLEVYMKALCEIA